MYPIFPTKSGHSVEVMNGWLEKDRGLLARGRARKERISYIATYNSIAFSVDWLVYLSCTNKPFA